MGIVVWPCENCKKRVENFRRAKIALKNSNNTTTRNNNSRSRGITRLRNPNESLENYITQPSSSSTNDNDSYSIPMFSPNINSSNNSQPQRRARTRTRSLNRNNSDATNLNHLNTFSDDGDRASRHAQMISFAAEIERSGPDLTNMLLNIFGPNVNLDQLRQVSDVPRLLEMYTRTGDDSNPVSNTNQTLSSRETIDNPSRRGIPTHYSINNRTYNNNRPNFNNKIGDVILSNRILGFIDLITGLLAPSANLDYLCAPFAPWDKILLTSLSKYIEFGTRFSKREMNRTLLYLKNYDTIGRFLTGQINSLPDDIDPAVSLFLLSFKNDTIAQNTLINLRRTIKNCLSQQNRNNGYPIHQDKDTSFFADKLLRLLRQLAFQDETKISNNEPKEIYVYEYDNDVGDYVTRLIDQKDAAEYKKNCNSKCTSCCLLRYRDILEEYSTDSSDSLDDTLDSHTNTERPFGSFSSLRRDNPVSNDGVSLDIINAIHGPIPRLNTPPLPLRLVSRMVTNRSNLNFGSHSTTSVNNPNRSNGGIGSTNSMTDRSNNNSSILNFANRRRNRRARFENNIPPLIDRPWEGDNDDLMTPQTNPFSWDQGISARDDSSDVASTYPNPSTSEAGGIEGGSTRASNRMTNMSNTTFNLPPPQGFSRPSTTLDSSASNNSSNSNVSSSAISDYNTTTSEYTNSSRASGSLYPSLELNDFYNENREFFEDTSNEQGSQVDSLFTDELTTSTYLNSARSRINPSRMGLPELLFLLAFGLRNPLSYQRVNLNANEGSLSIHDTIAEDFATNFYLRSHIDNLITMNEPNANRRDINYGEHERDVLGFNFQDSNLTGDENNESVMRARFENSLSMDSYMGSTVRNSADDNNNNSPIPNTNTSTNINADEEDKERQDFDERNWRNLFTSRYENYENLTDTNRSLTENGNSSLNNGRGIYNNGIFAYDDLILSEASESENASHSSELENNSRNPDYVTSMDRSSILTSSRLNSRQVGNRSMSRPSIENSSRIMNGSGQLNDGDLNQSMMSVISDFNNWRSRPHRRDPFERSYEDYLGTMPITELDPNLRSYRSRVRRRLNRH